MSIKDGGHKVKDPRYSRHTEEDFKNIAVMNILAKEWVDEESKSCFSTRVKLHYRNEKEECIYIGLTYDNAYEEAAAIILGANPWLLRAKYGFVLISNKVQVSTKKEVEEWGQK